MKKYAIIVAGGTGTRMNSDVPKQFMLLNGKPVIQYSVEAFYSFDASIQIILVIHPEFRAYWENLTHTFNITIPHAIVPGGETRFDSVKNGLMTIDGNGFIAIHDAARPLINARFVETVFNTAKKYGSAMPGIVLHDTIRMIDNDNSHQLDRTLLRAMQTPQVFKVTELKQAYNQSYQPVFTDDASVMQSAGFPLHLMDGSAVNIKITNPHDLDVAEVLLKSELHRS